MREHTPADWPHLLMAIGDQVYADEDAPETREFIRSRRDTSKPPYDEVLDFEEYTRLYWESWGEPEIRWLLSTVGTMMIFDDHDVHDDWKASAKWVREIRAEPWWSQRIRARAGVVLRLPAPREPVPRPARTERGVPEDEITAGRGRVPVRMGRAGRPRGERQPLELLAQLRPHQDRRVRLPRGPGARSLSAQDGRRHGVGAHRRGGDRATSTTWCWPTRCPC